MTNNIKYLIAGMIIIGAAGYLRSESPQYAPNTHSNYPWLYSVKSQTSDQIYTPSQETQINGYDANTGSSHRMLDGKADAPWLHPDNTQIPEDEIGNRGIILPPVEQTVDMAKISPPSTLERDMDTGQSQDGQIMWGTDQLVHSGGALTFGWLSMDHAENGELFVTTLKHQGGTADTIYHYGSMDGNTWTAFHHMYPAPSTYGDTILQQEVIVGPGTNPWIYTFFHSKRTGQVNTGGIYLRRMRADSTTWDWITIATPGDSIGHFGVDRDLNGVLYLVYMKQTSTGWRIYRTRSQDEGMTWDGPYTVSSGDRNWPQIASGAENKQYIVYEADGELIRVGAYQNWSPGTFTDIESGDGEYEFQATVAASRQQPAASQTAWIIYANDHNPNIDIHYTYTQDGGSTWASGTPWPPTNSTHDVWEMHHPWVVVSYDYSIDLNSVVVSVPSTTWDSVVFAWASSSDPSTWNDRGVHNDYRVTGEYGARVDLTSGIGGAGIVYREFASGEVWFDYWWNTDVKELGKPHILSSYNVTPVKGGALLKFTLPYGKMTKINIYSPSGRNLKSIEKYFGSGLNTYRVSLKTGIYFIRIDDQTAKIVTVK